jgi:hypothetical protein
MRSLGLLLILASLAAACGDGNSPTAPSSLPATLTLTPGQQANAGGLTIFFERVVADSRCPTNVTCIQAGDATLALNLSLGGVGTKYELTAVDPATRTVIYDDYKVEIAGLQPYPVSYEAIPQASYRATITVRSVIED